MTSSTPPQILPDSANPAAFQPVVVVAGRGSYPVISIDAARSAGATVRLVALRGETNDQTLSRFRPEDIVSIKVGQIGALLRAVRRFKARSVLMVGQVTPGRLFRGIHPDFKAIQLLRRLRVRNAHSIFGAIVAEIEKTTATVLDARTFLQDSLASPGPITISHRSHDTFGLEYGTRIARTLADLDIGQSVVIRKGTVLAVEGFDGTDGLIEYAGRFAAQGKILVKVAKADHDFRFDVPVIGATTIQKMAANGFSLLAVEAGRVLLLEKDRVLDLARQLRISVVGIPSRPQTDGEVH